MFNPSSRPSQPLPPGSHPGNLLQPTVVVSGRLSPGVSPSFQTTPGGILVDQRSVSPTIQLHPLGHQGSSAQFYQQRAPSPVLGSVIPSTVLTYTPSPSHVSLQPVIPVQQKGILLNHQPHEQHHHPVSGAAIIHNNAPVIAGPSNSINMTPVGPTTYSTFVGLDGQTFIASSPSGQQQQQQYIQQQYLQQQPTQETQLIMIDPLSLPSMFQDPRIKMDYVRKVLRVLFSQVGICFLIVNVFNLRAIKEWSQENSWFLWLFLVISLVILTIVASTADTYQDCPINSMLTVLFTLTSGLTIGSMSSFSFFDTSLQLIYYFDLTLILIFGLILSLILNAFISKQDLNICKWIGYIIVLVCLVIAAYLALIVFGNDHNFVKFLPTVFLASVSSLFYLIYVITDLTFMIHRCYYNSLTPDSVMLAVIYLHTDIVNPNGNFWGRC